MTTRGENSRGEARRGERPEAIGTQKHIDHRERDRERALRRIETASSPPLVLYSSSLNHEAPSSFRSLPPSSLSCLLQPPAGVCVCAGREVRRATRSPTCSSAPGGGIGRRLRACLRIPPLPPFILSRLSQVRGSSQEEGSVSHPMNPTESWAISSIMTGRQLLALLANNLVRCRHILNNSNILLVGRPPEGGRGA